MSPKVEKSCSPKVIPQSLLPQGFWRPELCRILHGTLVGFFFCLIQHEPQTAPRHAPKCSCGLCGLFCYEKDIILTQIIPSMIGISYQKLYQWFEGLNLQKNQEFPSVWRAIYSKKIIDDNNLLFTENIKMGEDLLFNWEYLAYAPDIYVCDTKYYHYVWRKGSLSQNSAEHFYTSRKALAIN